MTSPQVRREILYEDARVRIQLETGPASRGIAATLIELALSKTGLVVDRRVLVSSTQSRAPAGQRSIDLLHKIARASSPATIQSALARLASRSATSPQNHQESRP